jgi:hypothetical protein
MAFRLEEEATNGDPDSRFHHVCPLPWPVDPSLSEGHVCACGRPWSYQPAHWAPLFTLEELREQQSTGEYGRSVIGAPTRSSAKRRRGDMRTIG